MSETFDINYELHESSTDVFVVTTLVSQFLGELTLYESKFFFFAGKNSSLYSDYEIEPRLPDGLLWFKNASASS